MKDWKTTIPAAMSAFFGFVMFKPEHFPPLVVDIAAYAFAGGLLAFGISSAQVRKFWNGSKTEK